MILSAFTMPWQCSETESKLGALNGYLEATLEANPEIAKYGVFLPRGLTVILPEFVLSNPQSMVKRLWD